MNPLLEPIEHLKPKLKPELVPKFHKLGIYTAEDLLLYTPRKYVNFGRITTIDQLPQEQDKTPITLDVTVIKKKFSRIPRRRLTITEITVQDETGTLKIPLFNQKFLFDSIKEGGQYAVTATAKPRTKGLISNPSFERILPGKKLLHSHRLIPIYPETSGITSKLLRYRIACAENQLGHIPDILPQSVREQAGLPSIMETIQYLHYPESKEDIDKAKMRVAFNQAFITQLYLKKQKLLFQSKYAPQIPFQQDQTQAFIESLPYTLTDAQRKASWDIIQDMDSQTPMNRLLEGDVGTGKTLVAVLAMINVYLAQKQSALMAPTEILATQHFEGILKTFQEAPQQISPTIALLTASESRLSTEPELGHWTIVPKSDLKKRIAKGSVDIIIGTHTLITESTKYNDLALTIVDEQHRFGVKQRAELQNAISRSNDSTRDTISHLLSMTATPIPRTLALSLYGDLDLSLLDEYPAGRKPVKTKVVPETHRPATYTFIRKHIESGRQAFVVCPKIETTEDSDVKSVEETYQDLSQNIFPELRVRMMHGKMKPEEKDQIMQDFKNHQFDILVSTSVIEVGVNIPNASIMMIEGAERFGLAQLHQFRGRVGRGEHQSFCFLFETGADLAVMNERLQALEQATSGFDLAELDLKLRGPGQFIGSSQSGIADVSMEALTNRNVILAARKISEKILQTDSSLSQFPYLKWKLQHFRDTVHFE